MWCWANQSFKEECRKDAESLKNLKANTSKGIFEKEVFECNEEMAYELTAMGSLILSEVIGDAVFKKNKRYNDMSDSTSLWRYMSYSKFLDMIESSSLYFCRLDCFCDKLEATQPNGSVEFVKLTENPWQAFERYCVDKQLEICRNLSYANCWHINTNENPNMWENYVVSHGNEGVAIQTTFKDLVESLETERTITDIRMKYIDYGTEFMNFYMANIFDFFCTKDKQFEYENEMRLITVEDTYPLFDPDEENFMDKIIKHTNKGEKIPVDLHKLIKKIYISPSSTERFQSEVKHRVEKLSLMVSVIQSEEYILPIE